MSYFQANNGYDHYNNNLTAQQLNHLTRSEDIGIVVFHITFVIFFADRGLLIL